LLWRTASRVLRFSCAPLPRSHLFTLSLHDALPILIINDLCIFVSFYVFFKVSYNLIRRKETISLKQFRDIILGLYPIIIIFWIRSEEHTSELQSRFDLVCRRLLETTDPPRWPSRRS